jgi:branched-chain amino acid transport system ATP-binding protein
VSDPTARDEVPVLEVDDVRHAYDDVPVLNGVCLTVDRGSSVFVIGANGAGKSTLALTISGLVRPRSGSIRLEGRELVGRPPFQIARMGVSYTPAGRSVFHHMTVAENLELGFEAVRRTAANPRRAVAERIEELLELFPRLRREMRKQAGMLSGGLQRMVEVARALMPRPVLLILDEPTLGLSGAAVSDLIDAVLAVRETGTTLLVIEQNVPVATEMCERGYLLGGGRVALSGTAAEVVQDDQVRRTYLGVV